MTCPICCNKYFIFSEYQTHLKAGHAVKPIYKLTVDYFRKKYLVRRGELRLGLKYFICLILLSVFR